VTTSRERFTLTVEALPDAVPAAFRLRNFLKRALRSFVLKALDVRRSAGPAEEGRAMAAEPPQPSTATPIDGPDAAGATQEPRT
jgi:hypothetical protein